MTISLTTNRFALRQPTAQDLDTYRAFYAETDITVGGYRGGRSDAEVAAIHQRDMDHWTAKGFGIFLVCRLGDETVLGGVGISHPDDWPSHELTWWLMHDARGSGAATEASRAVIDWAYSTLHWPTVETHMRDENTPARNMAIRLGGTITRRDTFPDGVTRDVFTLPQTTRPIIPTVKTDRLTLRASKERDWDAIAAFYASDRAKYVGGPKTRNECWSALSGYLGHWQLRGYGFWQIEETATGETVGAAGFINPPAWGEPELGWHLYNGHEGKGFAYEAAAAARDFGAKHFGLNGVISYIAHENARSIKLAEKLGATLECEGEVVGEPCLIYRHPKQESLH